MLTGSQGLKSASHCGLSTCTVIPLAGMAHWFHESTGKQLAQIGSSFVEDVRAWGFGFRAVVPHSNCSSGKAPT